MISWLTPVSRKLGTPQGADIVPLGEQTETVHINVLLGGPQQASRGEEGGAGDVLSAF